MESIRYKWSDDSGDHVVELVYVAGTYGRPYPFGEPPSSRHVEVNEVVIARLWRGRSVGGEFEQLVLEAGDLQARVRVLGVETQRGTRFA